MTLLELLVVVFILSAIALTTVSVVDSHDEQLRYDDTKTRLNLVKKGILGDPSLSVNGQPMVSGFIADIGRLPNNLQELLEHGDLPPWAYYESTGLWSGWRGPYVTPRQENGPNGQPILTFRDGWDNLGEAPLFGWKSFEIQTGSGSLVMQSFGADGKEGGDGYAADFPLDDPGAILIKKWDYIVDFSELPYIEADIVTNTNMPSKPVRLRVLYPRHGSLDAKDLPEWPEDPSERDRANDLSCVQTIEGSVSSGSKTIRFDFNMKDASGDRIPKEIPVGKRYIVLVDESTGEILNDDYDLPPIVVHVVPKQPLLIPKQYWTLGL